MSPCARPQVVFVYGTKSAEGKVKGRKVQFVIRLSYTLGISLNEKRVSAVECIS